MIEAGTPSQIAWGDGKWVFLDMGFSRDARSCGILVGNGNPTSEQFGAAKRRMVSLAKGASITIEFGDRSAFVRLLQRSREPDGAINRERG